MGGGVGRGGLSGSGGEGVCGRLIYDTLPLVVHLLHIHRYEPCLILILAPTPTILITLFLHVRLPLLAYYTTRYSSRVFYSG